MEKRAGTAVLQLPERAGARRMPETLEEHIEVADVADESGAQAIPPEEVKAPFMRMATYLEEGFAIARKAKQEEDALVAVGMARGAPELLESNLEALHSAHVVVQALREARHSAKTASLLSRARLLRNDGIAAATLALRKQPEQLRRLGEIRAAGAGAAELPLVLAELVVLLRDQAPFLARAGFDVAAVAPEMTDTMERLRQSRAADEAVRIVARARERRNRIYTLTAIQIADLRALAAYAFRNDPTDRRRSAFPSGWIRSRNRAARRRKQVASGAGSTPTSPGTDAASASGPVAERNDEAG